MQEKDPPSTPATGHPAATASAQLGISRFRPLILTFVIVATVLEIVALSPSSVEESAPPSAAIEPESLIEDEPNILATEIPKGRVPDYSMEQFNYVSSEGSTRQWKMVADKAFIYQSPKDKDDKLVHSRNVIAYLYDPDGKITVIQGREAKFFMKKKDLEVFGDVVTTFPDGFVIESDYMQHRVQERTIVVPTQYLVHGGGVAKGTPVATPNPIPGASHAPDHSGDSKIRFTSMGLRYEMAQNLITLPHSVRMLVESPRGATSGSPTSSPKPSPSSSAPLSAAPSVTTIESDRCVIHRDKQVAYFTMDPARPPTTRWVHITQPHLFCRSRRADLNYGSYPQIVNYMTAFEDVLIKELGAEDVKGARVLRYGTGGRADFDGHRNVIVLREYPQVYENNDTVTGDVITLHRDTDIVEVEHSNAFSQGTEPSPLPTHR